MTIAILEKKSESSDNVTLYNHVTSSLSTLDLEMILKVPTGGNWKDIPLEIAQKSARLMQIRESGGRTTYYGRLRNNLPSYTINTYFNRPGNGTFIHPTQHRLISFREAARLQSFPDHYRFLGSNSSKLKQIGNAVPPLLARAIGKQLDTGRSIDLFSGAGGLSEGLSTAGHNVIAAVDSNQNMSLTHSYNHPDTKFIESDMANPIGVQLVIDEIENLLSGKNLNMIAGGPPCQGFSTAGKWNIGDPRNALLFSMFRLINHFRPSLVLIENVVGLLWMKKGKILESVMDQLRSIDYYPHWYKLHAEEYGVPQRRQRIFILASTNKEITSAPPSIFSRLMRGKHRNEIRSDPAMPFPVTVGDAISDMPELVAGSGKDEMQYKRQWIRSDYQKMMRSLVSISSFLESQSKKG